MTNPTFRATLLFTVAFLLLISSADMILAQHPPSQVDVEHRFTALESAVATMAADIHDLKERGQWEWLKGLGLAGLVGEAGLRSMRRKKVE